MKKILVIGGGAMGSAFTIPCLENKNKVTITEPYSKAFIKNLSSKNKFHSSLKINLPKSLKFRKFSTDLLKEKFDLTVIALSLSGIDFISKELKKLKSKNFAFCVELPIKVEQFNYNYIDFPCYELKRIGGKKKVNAFKDGFLILAKMLELFFKRIFNNE